MRARDAMVRPRNRSFVFSSCVPSNGQKTASSAKGSEQRGQTFTDASLHHTGTGPPDAPQKRATQRMGSSVAMPTTTRSTSRAARPLFEGPIVRRAMLDAVKKLDPRLLIKNPVMFVVEIGSAFTTALFLHALTGEGDAPAGSLVKVLIERATPNQLQGKQVAVLQPPTVVPPPSEALPGVSLDRFPLVVA
jgi:hypothetical protein